MTNLQKAILVIADEIDGICRKYNIKYYICGGTLLGAIRHGGFIPWDDDFDIIIKRKEYDRFIKAVENEIDHNKFFLQTENTEERYCFNFAKLQLVGTEMIEEFSINVPIHHGVFVDIFPLDNLPDNKWKRKIMRISNYVLKNIIWIKCGYGVKTHGSKLGYKIVKCASILIPLKRLRKLRNKILTKYNRSQTAEGIIGDYPDDRHVNTWFDESEKYKFEGREYIGMTRDCAHSYLSGLFGDYMKIPPESERKPHGKYGAVLGAYEEMETERK